jgi:hypothetical protein
MPGTSAPATGAVAPSFQPIASNNEEPGSNFAPMNKIVFPIDYFSGEYAFSFEASVFKEQADNSKTAANCPKEKTI